MTSKLHVSSVSEIQVVVNLTLERSGILSRQGSIEQSLNNLICDVKNQKQSLVSQILIGILINLLFYIMTPYVQQVQEVSWELIRKNRSQIVKYINEEYSVMDLDRDIIGEYRFIKSESLDVRSKNFFRSNKLDTIYFSKVVKVVYKMKNWL